MRVGMIPDNPLEWLLAKTNAVPFPVADTFAAMMQARTIMAGVRLGVFGVLAEGPASITKLAERLSCQERGIQALLDALVGCRYVVESDGRYRISPRARKWLTPNDPHSVNRFIDFNYDNWEWWGHLEDAIRTGKSLDLHAQLQGIDAWRRYLYGLHDLSKMAAKEMVFRLRLKPGHRRILDIGGGHGAYVAAYCRKYPDVKAEILDLPPAVEVGKEIVDKYDKDVADRIEFRPGDVEKDPLGNGYDVVFLFNLIHHFNGEGNRRIFNKVSGAMNPGGRFVVLDQFKRPMQTDSYAAVLTQLMFLVTSSAGSHGLDEVRQWLEGAGFSNVRTRDLRVGPGTSYVIATKR